MSIKESQRKYLNKTLWAFYDQKHSPKNIQEHVAQKVKKDIL